MFSRLYSLGYYDYSLKRKSSAGIAGAADLGNQKTILVLDVGGYYNHAHNDYLEFATETGLVGLALLGLAVISSLLVAVIAQYRRRDPLMRGLSFAAIMGICAIMIHSTVDFNLQIPANAITFMLLLAMGWIALGMKSKRKVMANDEDEQVNNKYWT